MATTRSSSSGVFKFGFVTRSAFYTQPGWSYMIVATKSGARAVVTGVTVAAGQDTPVGSVIIPASGVAGDR
ncbi:MAG TPA: hypothetical protein VFO55_00665 [Gemmatimonadaceae bacterium]|nr:hypothetical protein [Gemmatimonadaceae bacterium]